PFRPILISRTVLSQLFYATDHDQPHSPRAAPEFGAHPDRSQGRAHRLPRARDPDHGSSRPADGPPLRLRLHGGSRLSLAPAAAGNRSHRGTAPHDAGDYSGTQPVGAGESVSLPGPGRVMGRRPALRPGTHRSRFTRPQTGPARFAPERPA